MAIKRYKKIYTVQKTHDSVLFDEITKSTPEKSLVVHLKKNSGRNNQGKITVRHKGGGAAIKIQTGRLQTQQRWYSCNSKSNRIRSQQNSKHRSDRLR